MMRFFKPQISKADYKVEKEIGLGSFSTVLKATYQGKEAAVKVMPYNTNTIKYCEQEIKVLQCLTEAKAPGVVKYYGCNYESYPTGEQTLSLVLEYMSKGDLSTYIENEKKKPFSWQQRYNIMCQITNALAFIHSKGYVYCDMKGDNVLLDENFNAKICDFNLTHQVNEKKASGTIPYAAPEILIGNKFNSFSTDIYSLAITFWELAAWRKPHQDVPAGDIVTMFAEEPGKRMEIPEGCPKNIARLIAWGWCENPKERPSAQEVLEELQSEETQRQVLELS